MEFLDQQQDPLGVMVMDVTGESELPGLGVPAMIVVCVYARRRL